MSRVLVPPRTSLSMIHGLTMASLVLDPSHLDKRVVSHSKQLPSSTSPDGRYPHGLAHGPWPVGSMDVSQVWMPPPPSDSSIPLPPSPIQITSHSSTVLMFHHPSTHPPVCVYVEQGPAIESQHTYVFRVQLKLTSFMIRCQNPPISICTLGYLLTYPVAVLGFVQLTPMIPDPDRAPSLSFS